MIEKISLKNFKLHRSTEIAMPAFTVFIGLNNSGKSSILQAMLCLKQICQMPPFKPEKSLFVAPIQKRNNTSQDLPYLYPPDTIVELGEFNELVSNLQDPLVLKLSGTIFPSIKEIKQINVNIEFAYTANRFLYSKGSILIPEKQPLIGIDPFPKQFEWELRTDSQSHNPQAFRFGEGNFQIQLDTSQDLFGPIRQASSYQSITSERRSILERALDILLDAPKQLIRSIHPVYSVRGIEEGAFPFPSAQAKTIDMALLADRAIAIGSVLAYDEKAEHELSAFTKDLLGFEVLTRPKQPLQMTIRNKEKNTLLVNEGTGAQQLPFVFLPIAQAEPNATLLIAEPEAHLHPKLQFSIASQFIKINKKQNKQFIIETHSEHILNAFLNAVASRQLSKEDVAIYYFGEPKERSAKVDRLEITEKGQVTGGLPGFFEQSLEELVQLLDAARPKP